MTHIKLNIGWPLFLTSHTVLPHRSTANGHEYQTFSSSKTLPHSPINNKGVFIALVLKALIFTQSLPLSPCRLPLIRSKAPFTFGDWLINVTSLLLCVWSKHDQCRLFLLVFSHVIRNLTNHWSRWPSQRTFVFNSTFTIMPSEVQKGNNLTPKIQWHSFQLREYRHIVICIDHRYSVKLGTVPIQWIKRTPGVITTA